MRNRTSAISPSKPYHFFYIFGYLIFFSKYKKNKIGILENDIYIFPVVNSVSLLVHIVWAVFAPYLGAFEGIPV